MSVRRARGKLSLAQANAYRAQRRASSKKSIRQSSFRRREEQETHLERLDGLDYIVSSIEVGPRRVRRAEEDFGQRILSNFRSRRRFPEVVSSSVESSSRSGDVEVVSLPERSERRRQRDGIFCFFDRKIGTSQSTIENANQFVVYRETKGRGLQSILVDIRSKNSNRRRQIELNHAVGMRIR